MFELWQEGLGSSQVVTGTSGNLSCCLREVKPPFKFLGAPWDSSRAAAEKQGHFLIWGGKLKVPFQFQEESWGSYRVSTGESGLISFQAWNSAFLSSCKRGVRPLIELRWGMLTFSRVQPGSQTSLHVVRGHLGFLSSQCMEVSPYLELRGSWCPVDLWQVLQGSSRFSIVETGLLLKWGENLDSCWVQVG